jgi:hypothetical protein
VILTVAVFPIYFIPEGTDILRLERRLLLDTWDTAVIFHVRVLVSTITPTSIPTSRVFARASSISRRISGSFPEISSAGVHAPTV